VKRCFECGSEVVLGFNRYNFLQFQLSEQILVLEKAVKITELGIRVRFLAANHLEQSMEKFFPGGCILPFGSTVSGIGRRSGDLDLVLLPDKVHIILFFIMHPTVTGINSHIM